MAARARPVISTREQVLPVSESLVALFPSGLRRGSVVVVDGVGTAGGVGGATTLAVSLLAEASATGSWCATVGFVEPGVVAVAELGVDVERLAFVPRPGAMWPEVTAAMLDGMELVLVCPPGPVRAAVARRLAARVRERRAVLVVLARHSSWPEGPDVCLTVEGGAWQGVEPGHGHLRGRRVIVATGGRRAAIRPVRAELWLPAASGAVDVVEQVQCGEVEEKRPSGEEAGGAVARRVVLRSPAGEGAR